MIEKRLALNIPKEEEDQIDRIFASNSRLGVEDCSQNEDHPIFLNKKEVKQKKQKDDLIRKKKNQRKNYDKWTDEEKKIYWFGLMNMVEENPLVKHSWGNWKVDKCFKKMQRLFKGNKKNTQIKSFDQRMKKYYKEQRGVDIEEAICMALRDLCLNQLQLKIINDFQLSKRQNRFIEFKESQRTLKTIQGQISQNQGDVELAKRLFQTLTKF